MSAPLQPADDQPWQVLRSRTQARVGLGRVGSALPTEHHLALRQAHAAARDAIHAPLDNGHLVEVLRAAGCGEPVVVHSAAADRSEYLRRPDLGRRLAPGTHLERPAPAETPLSGTPLSDAPRLAIVVVDGLSTSAVHQHAATLVGALRDLLTPRFELLAPVVVEQGRVAIGDQIGSELGADAVVVLVGERPGLSVSDSLGAYLTWAPTIGRRDSERNCVSNIREPGGLAPSDAAAVLARLLTAAQVGGGTGVHLKDVDELES